MQGRREGDEKSLILMDQDFDNSFAMITDLIRGHQRYTILLSAITSGILQTLIQNGPMRVENLVSELECDKSKIDLWIQAIVDIGILKKDGDFVEISRGMTKFLNPKSAIYQGDSIISKQESPWYSKGNFLMSNAQLGEKTRREMTPEFLKVVGQHAMRGEIQEITKILSTMTEFTSARKLLDIGGGHGLYSISLCQQNIDLNSVILDQPHIIEATKENVTKFRMEKQIEVISGDMNKEIPGTGYDLMLASHILYHKETLEPHIRRFVSGLRNGGLFISNHKFSTDWKLPENDVLTALEHEMIRDFHQMIPESDFIEILKAQGLDLMVTRRVQSTTGLSTLHIARKM